MTGEYVVCVDSDDYISPTHIEGLYHLIEKYGADVSINTFCSFLEGTLPQPQKVLLMITYLMVFMPLS